MRKKTATIYLHTWQRHDLYKDVRSHLYFLWIDLIASANISFLQLVRTNRSFHSNNYFKHFEWEKVELKLCNVILPYRAGAPNTRSLRQMQPSKRIRAVLHPAVNIFILRLCVDCKEVPLNCWGNSVVFTLQKILSPSFLLATPQISVRTTWSYF